MPDPLVYDLSPYRVLLFPGEQQGTVLYAHLDAQEAAQVFSLLPEPRPALAAVSGTDWNRQFSPWPASKAYRGGEDFSGGAAPYLRDLLTRILPAVEESLPSPVSRRGIAGYSLAGLFALWTLYQTDAFSLCASMSGSLWFDGFLDYMEQHSPKRAPDRLYLSLGDRESSARSPRLASVEDCTRRAFSLLSPAAGSASFELNPGGHFQDVPRRIAAGLRYLAAP